MKRKVNLTRREFLRDGAIVATGALLAACGAPAVTPAPPTAAPSAPTTAPAPTTVPTVPAVVSNKQILVRFYTDETDPTTQQVFAKAADAFAAQNPGVKVQMEYGGFDARQVIIPAGVAAKKAPAISKLAASEALYINSQGFLTDMTSIIQDMGGESAWAPGSLDELRAPNGGGLFGVPSVGQQYRTLWYRTDMLQKAGLQPPTTWDEWKNVAQKLTGNGSYGVSIAGGKNLWTQDTYLTFLWQTGEVIYDKDFNITLGGPGALAALEFYKEMVQYAPPDFASYSWGETVTGFVTGKCATQQYGARTLKQVYDSNKDILPSTHCIYMPLGPLGSDVGFMAFDPYVIFNEKAGLDSDQVAVAKEYVKFLLTGKLALDWYGSVPGHQIPPYLALQKDPDLWTKHPLFTSNKDDILKCFNTKDLIDTPMQSGAVITKASVTSGKLNPYAGTVDTELPIAQMVQRVVVNNEDPKTALAWGVQALTTTINNYKKTLGP